MPLRLYNSLSRQLEPFTPRDPSRVTFYSCGPTVYDDAHVGNFRSFLAADVLRRWIESPLCDLQNDPAKSTGRKVVHVMNITDVGHMTDDAEGGENGEDRMAVAGKRLLEAKKSGKLPAGTDTNLDPTNPYTIAEFYASRFLEDARRLGLKVALDAQSDPTLMPRPTQCIPQMIAMIQSLISKGHAYAVGPAGRQVVYYDVQSFPAYGRLSGNTLDNLRSGAGGRISDENQGQKKHPADFLLWKADPSHIMKWDSPWGAGYPGWHIECSVMAAMRLADDLGEIDLHSGGEDNVFPHHECEIAQTCGHTGRELFARTWFHPRHLFIEGAKMSKSKGNFYTARDLFAKGIEPAAIRLELIRTHYRTNANFTMQGVTDSQRMVERWRRISAVAGTSTNAAAAPRLDDSPVLREFAQAMNEDLNIAGALGVLNSWAGTITQPTASDAAILAAIDRVLGVLALEVPKATATEIGVYLGGLSPDPTVEAKLAERKAARAAKDFKRSDELRDELLALGYQLKDVAGGKVEISRKP
ncbi:MAG: cysteine--tRNA ligase [Phycisphaerales bacterium]|nr:cysteine--tRNA ligase [Phycisphaerales bacterium]